MPTNSNPKKTASKSKADKQVKEKTPPVYADPSVQDYSFADYARVQMNSRGALLSFGKSHPGRDHLVIFEEIFLPHDIAFALSNIIRKQFEELKEQGILEIVEKSEEVKK